MKTHLSTKKKEKEDRWMILSDLHPSSGNERVWAMQPLCRNMGLSQDSAYSLGKMNARKCKLNFMILQTDLAIDSLNFNGIMNQVHYSDNQFNLNIQPIFNICFVNKVMIWYPVSQLQKINFMNCIAISHKERCIMYKNLLIALHQSVLIVWVTT